ncbi:TPA: hypothetical protein QCR24_002842 [Bacillus cereus]|nr:hypothetical protein [Bacillus cereus]
MIYVNRSNVSMPAVLDTSNSSSLGSIETQDCIAYYFNSPSDPFDFKIYRDPEVVRKLNDLFYGKCAYCESSVQTVNNIEVEHYRPKGRIRVKKEGKWTWTQTGYYWLGAVWENLLPSCTFCNQLRKHETEDGQMITAGKWSYFPLENENQRVFLPTGNLGEESPLLLNPCVDDPSKHLDFQTDGTVTHRTERGRISLGIYGLWRRDLKRRRHEKVKEIEFLIIRVRQNLKMLSICKEIDMRIHLLQELDELLAHLKTFTEPEKLYAGVAKQLISSFFNEISQDLTRVSI